VIFSTVVLARIRSSNARSFVQRRFSSQESKGAGCCYSTSLNATRGTIFTFYHSNHTLVHRDLLA